MAGTQRGWVLTLYEHSLAIAFFVLFFASWALHAMGGAKAFNEEQLQHGEAAISVWRYATTSQFWFESMQNWQSEFIAVAAISGVVNFLAPEGFRGVQAGGRTAPTHQRVSNVLACSGTRPVSAGGGEVWIQSLAAQGRKYLRRSRDTCICE